MVKKQKIKVEAEVEAELEKPFELILTLGDKIYTAKGNDVVSLFQSIKPESIKTKGVFVLKSGNMMSESVRPIPIVKKIFANKDNALIFSKFLITRLK